MAKSAKLHVRLDDDIKAGGNAALADVGLSAADAVRNRVIADQAFPLELKVPNAATRIAMVEADGILAERAAHYADSEAMIGAMAD